MYAPTWLGNYLVFQGILVDRGDSIWCLSWTKLKRWTIMVFTGLKLDLLWKMTIEVLILIVPIAYSSCIRIKASLWMKGLMTGFENFLKTLCNNSTAQAHTRSLSHILVNHVTPMTRVLVIGWVYSRTSHFPVLEYCEAVESAVR